MNEIKDIELEIYNLGENLNPNNLLPLINEMEKFVNGSYPLPHPLLKPASLHQNFSRFKSSRFPRVENSKALQFYTVEYCEACQNFILRNRDDYWSNLEIEFQKTIEYRIITCIRMLKSMLLEYGIVLTNLSSLESIAKAQPVYELLADYSKLKDADILEILEEVNSTNKLVAILQMSGVLPLLMEYFKKDMYSDLAPLLSLIFNTKVGTMRRTLGDLNSQLNGARDIKNTSFKESQIKFLSKIEDVLVKLGLPSEEIRSRIPPIEFGDE